CVEFLSTLISPVLPLFVVLFFFNATATTEIYTLSLHDALPIWQHIVTQNAAGKGVHAVVAAVRRGLQGRRDGGVERRGQAPRVRSEEHTSELQSHLNLVCRLLLEKKKR